MQHLTISLHVPTYKLATLWLLNCLCLCLMSQHSSQFDSIKAHIKVDFPLLKNIMTFTLLLTIKD